MNKVLNTAIDVQGLAANQETTETGTMSNVQVQVTELKVLTKKVMNKEALKLLKGAIENAAKAANDKMVRQSGVGDYLTACTYAQDLASFYKFLDGIRFIDDAHKLQEVDDWGFIKWWALEDDGINCIHEYAEDNDLKDYENEVIKLFE